MILFGAPSVDVAPVMPSWTKAIPCPSRQTGMTSEQAVNEVIPDRVELSHKEFHHSRVKRGKKARIAAERFKTGEKIEKKFKKWLKGDGHHADNVTDNAARKSASPLAKRAAHPNMRIRHAGGEA